MMVSFDLLEHIRLRLLNQGINSKSDIEELYKQGKLQEILEENNFHMVLKHDIKTYLDCLFYNNAGPYYKKMIMEMITRGRLHCISQYMLAWYCDNEYAYRNLPLLLKGLIDKLDISEYKYVSLEDITQKVYATFDLVCRNDPNINQWICEIDHKFMNEKYHKYSKGFDIMYAPTYDEEAFSVWAEYRVYQIEMQNLKKYNADDKVIWAAKEHGDGQGFDVLSYDPICKREKLIEVKSGKSKTFYLTENELKVMKNCKYKNAEYYIYKYTHNCITNKVDLDWYYYNPELDLVLDKDNNKYDFDPQKYWDERGNKKYKYKIKPVELNKVKTLN